MLTPGKLVVLKLDGDLQQQGFRVTLEIAPEGDRPLVEQMATLPPDTKLVSSLHQWQQTYRNQGVTSRIMPEGITYVGSVNWWADCQQLARTLADRFNDWLASPQFRPIDLCLRETLSLSESIRVMIRAQDADVRRLPWHVWDVIERYTKAEVGLGALSTQRVVVERATTRAKIRILAILGNAHGIDIATDRQMLEQLPDATVTFLVEPARREVTQQLWDQPWDILFFAGHSQAEGNQGRIYLNSQESLTLEELKYSLRQAIAQGLQLAIFNSCDGLGLAQELEQLHLPQLIVMREPVPDPVAQEFLKNFLQAFVRGNPLYLAVREARERLQGLEGEFPCASWLPIICQNSLHLPLSWPDLLGHPDSTVAQLPAALNPSSSKPRLADGRFHWPWWRLVVLNSWIITCLVMTIRLLGGLQAVELLAFDQLMRLRPEEKPDDRIVLITIDEADLAYQNRANMSGRGSLSDRALSQLLTKLKSYQPRVIGLDIYRDFPASADLPQLKPQLLSLIGVCAIGVADYPPVNPPPELAPEQLGFSDLPLDFDQGIRRYTIGMTPGSYCKTDQSWAYRLALRYLSQQGLKPTFLQGLLRIDQQPIPQLAAYSGGYQTEPEGGYGVLLNYRSRQTRFRQISLTEMLDSDIHPNLSSVINHRVVLIGTIARSYNDYHQTPYGQMSGLEIQAHAVSQLLSAVMDGRPLLWTLPQWGDALWVGGWSIVSGILAVQLRSRILLGAANCVVLAGLYGVCFVLLLRGGWLPVVPSTLGVIGTSYLVAIGNSRSPSLP